jgi:hypothetical protein
MLLAAAAVALPTEKGNTLTPASALGETRTRAEQLINEGKEMWEGAVRAAGGINGDMSDVMSGFTADADQTPFGSVSLVVNQTGHECTHVVPLDTNFHTSGNTNRHKYNAGKFGPRAPQAGWAEFLGPHQTAEWFGVSPTMGGLSLHKKAESGHDAVRISSITLDKPLYVDSFDLAGLPMPNGAFYPQMSDPNGYPRPLYLAPHTGFLKVTITEASGAVSVHRINLEGTTWENGQEGTWRRLKVGKRVQDIKIAGGSESTWAVRNFCGAYHPGGTVSFAKPSPQLANQEAAADSSLFGTPLDMSAVNGGTATNLAAAEHLDTHKDENRTVVREAQQAQAAFQTAEAELRSTETDLQNKHSALKQAKHHLKSKRTELTIMKIPDQLEQAKVALKAENNKLNANRAELVQDLQKVGAKERALEESLQRHEEEKHQRQQRAER